VASFEIINYRKVGLKVLRVAIERLFQRGAKDHRNV
jgi:hypothetical protein